MLSLLAFAGCAYFGGNSSEGVLPLQGPVLQNPLVVPAMDREFLWNQIVDTVDDYFRIEREERMRSDGGIVTDGRIQTFPTTGATYLEPWRDDSSPGFERLHATLQSIRRYAKFQVSPADNGYAIDIAVYKQLEDVAQPEQAPVGASMLRHDNSLIRNERDPLAGPPTLGWIPLGRDFMLEQRMIAELQGRLAVSPAVQRLPEASY